jgi:trehalose 6-phosphate synthase/phosphatase
VLGENSTVERLVVVSNRLPQTLKRQDGKWTTERSSGGLATAMEPLLRQTGGIWIGWPGDPSKPADSERQRILREWAEQDGAIAVEMPADLVSDFYEGYPNQAVWPLFHYLPSWLRFAPKGWNAYVEANRRFCGVVAASVRDGDWIWIHDYQLMLLPRMLRDDLPNARIGFFLHIPFPSSEVFSILPRGDEVLEGLLGADFVAFHTHRYLQHFRSSLLRVLGIESEIDSVDFGGRSIGLGALPIGIAPEEFHHLISDDGETARYHADLKTRYAGQQVMLAVDRLDYTKGLPQRLRTFRNLLTVAPELAGNVTLIQVAVPSREGIESYQDLRVEVNQLVGEINGKLGTTEWTPVVYVNRGIQRTELAALYRLADVAWVTPLRDGMNLVAKEYAACKPEGDGVLVLSEFAGAAAEMGEALLVNPYDEERTAEVVLRALRLDPVERRDRMIALYRRVLRNNVFRWGERFLAELKAAAARSTPSEPRARWLDPAKVMEAYREAKRRLLILDYDGTLAPYASLPAHAAPDADLIGLLERLSKDPANCTALISGRRSEEMERWFGRIEKLGLGAEHGAKLRLPGQHEWNTLRPEQSNEWKDTVRPVLEHFVDRTPGSFIEEKEYSLVWHYRMSEPEFREWLAGELVALLEGMLAQTELRAYRGRKTVEVKPTWANKGALVERFISLCTDSDFRFAVGDDRTDEDIFTALDADAWTVHVGFEDTRARFRVPDVPAVILLLRQFVKS